MSIVDEDSREEESEKEDEKLEKMMDKPESFDEASMICSTNNGSPKNQKKKKKESSEKSFGEIKPATSLYSILIKASYYNYLDNKDSMKKKFCMLGLMIILFGTASPSVKKKYLHYHICRFYPLQYNSIDIFLHDLIEIAVHIPQKLIFEFAPINVSNIESLSILNDMIQNKTMGKLSKLYVEKYNSSDYKITNSNTSFNQTGNKQIFTKLSKGTDLNKVFLEKEDQQNEYFLSQEGHDLMNKMTESTTNRNRYSQHHLHHFQLWDDFIQNYFADFYPEIMLNSLIGDFKLQYYSKNGKEKEITK
eukprot:CAMPEP_0170520162 /NCGR_PEP_ID=MMETSP0209-20121228/5405_1 /TAXON_ID=665100 ORGANISM="Litonotus pictus, Strain P1" /NCGR_SAMPLE_ID=MMETSP0209 /ASSEMBLY_ACC=CAM_ASM_000301 /LENGTH=304 /DNA_ID=CAMNT_0010806303 /DNA_START=621 /DNA_END=1535 /DNA_ORIENTATION=+